MVQNLKHEDPITPMMVSVNELCDIISPLKLREFCAHVSKFFGEAISEINTEQAVPVKPEELTKFTEKTHKHQIGDDFKLRTMILFDTTGLSPESTHIAFNVSNCVKEHVLKQKTSKYLSSVEQQQRSLTDASKSRLRYVGGYCINKLKRHYVKKMHSTMYDLNKEEEYEKCLLAVELLQSVREEEEYLKSNTDDIESLQDVIRKQNIGRGLTHITDNLYSFFCNLCEKTLKLLVKENLNKAGENMYQYCITELQSDEELQTLFFNCCSSERKSDLLSEEEDCGEQLVKQELFQEICKRFLHIMFSQFRKDLLQSYKVGKTMEHRKQVLVKKKKKETVMKSISYDTIIKDNTNGKEMSHSLMRGLLLNKSDFLSLMLKSQLVKLCAAYNVRPQGKKLKADLIEALSKTVPEHTSMPNPNVFQSVASEEETVARTGPTQGMSTDVEVSAEESRPLLIEEPVPSTSGLHTREIASGTSTVETEDTRATSHSVEGEDLPAGSQMEEKSEETCKVCDKAEGKTWIFCDSCQKWLHRNCAGLRSKSKWNRYQKPGVPFFCEDCK